MHLTRSLENIGYVHLSRGEDLVHVFIEPLQFMLRWKDELLLLLFQQVQHILLLCSNPCCAPDGFRHHSLPLDACRKLRVGVLEVVKGEASYKRGVQGYDVVSDVWKRKSEAITIRRYHEQ